MVGLKGWQEKKMATFISMLDFAIGLPSCQVIYQPARQKTKLSMIAPSSLYVPFSGMTRANFQGVHSPFPPAFRRSFLFLPHTGSEDLSHAQFPKKMYSRAAPTKANLRRSRALKSPCCGSLFSPPLCKSLDEEEEAPLQNLPLR